MLNISILSLNFPKIGIFTFSSKFCILGENFSVRRFSDNFPTPQNLGAGQLGCGPLPLPRRVWWGKPSVLANALTVDIVCRDTLTQPEMILYSWASLLWWIEFIRASGFSAIVSRKRIHREISGDRVCYASTWMQQRSALMLIKHSQTRTVCRSRRVVPRNLVSTQLSRL